MSPTILTILITLAGLAGAYAVCEWVVRRREGSDNDDNSARG